ncbi:hypothetical protein [Paraburkholderia megapolitana]|uniref:Uncharacterized protein n=1 Tax=Paraburkholderia megapolitana TaxID=420953 RepID=A0A1I3MK06_9BURK|nr:hypothetical protein [Paraburkholderia megapolitana]QDQ84045.1 hypothetical protein FNZ07_23225 [Paraburkholderia megapolitana]SFI97313.1 hypothetical protein SAMN05192543_1055 [Paraburkholderia megapolitana]
MSEVAYSAATDQCFGADGSLFDLGEFERQFVVTPAVEGLTRLGIEYLPATAFYQTGEAGQWFERLRVDAGSLAGWCRHAESETTITYVNFPMGRVSRTGATVVGYVDLSMDQISLTMGCSRDLRLYWSGVQEDYRESQADTSYVSETDQFLSALYRLSVVDDGQPALEFGFDFIERAFRANNLARIDRVLAHAQPSQITVWASVGMLRATFRAKDKLGAWQRFFEGTRTVLREKNLNDKKMLRGL